MGQRRNHEVRKYFETKEIKTHQIWGMQKSKITHNKKDNKDEKKLMKEKKKTAIEKSTRVKSWFSENVNIIDKPQVRLIEKKREDVFY